MFNYKKYPSFGAYPYYKFDVWVWINNSVFLKIQSAWYEYFIFGIYGYLKYWFLTVLVFLKLKKSVEVTDVLEHYLNFP